MAPKMIVVKHLKSKPHRERKMEDDTVLCRIRDLPRDTHDLLKERARRHRRSLNQQLIVDLEDLAHQECAAQQSADNREKL